MPRCRASSKRCQDISHQAWTTIDEAGIDLNKCRTCVEFFLSISPTQDAANTDDGRCFVEQFTKGLDDLG